MSTAVAVGFIWIAFGLMPCHQFWDAMDKHDSQSSKPWKIIPNCILGGPITFVIGFYFNHIWKDRK